MEDLIELPDEVTVEYDYLVGYNFKDKTGRIIVQHTKDNNSIRKLVWAINEKLEKERL